MQVWPIGLVLIFGMASSGCTWATYNSIHRDWKLGTQLGKADAIDAKQRVILSKRLDETGAAVSCAEPSPDALQVLSMALAAEVTDPRSGATGRLAGSSSEGALSIGLRTQTIQLLRDGMYRLCEGYFNSAMNGPSFKTAHLRYQDAMVALLAIEQLTGAARPQLGAIGGQGSATVNVAAPASNQAATPPASVSVSTSSNGNTTATPAIDPDVSKEVADAVRSIVETMLEKDYSLQFCIEYLASSARESDVEGGRLEVVAWCKGLLEAELAQAVNPRALRR